MSYSRQICPAELGSLSIVLVTRVTPGPFKLATRVERPVVEGGLFVCVALPVLVFEFDGGAIRGASLAADWRLLDKSICWFEALAPF